MKISRVVVLALVVFGVLIMGCICSTEKAAPALTPVSPSQPSRAVVVGSPHAVGTVVPVVAVPVKVPLEQHATVTTVVEKPAAVSPIVISASAQVESTHKTQDTVVLIEGLISHVADGDTVVFLSPINTESSIPEQIRTMIAARKTARAHRNYTEADRLRDAIGDAGYHQDDKTGVVSLRFRIRLAGIDSPETKQVMGPEAGQFLKKLAEGHSGAISIRTPADRYGRTVADLFVRPTPTSELVWVQEQMLRSGWAWHYATYDNRPQLAGWERESREAHRGLWAQQKPQAPWEWRRQHPRATAAD